MKFHYWGTFKNDPYPHYAGGEIVVYDEVEMVGISLFEMDRLCGNAGIYGYVKYYGRANSGFQRLKTDRQLHAYCKENAALVREVNLYLKVSLHEILVLEQGKDNNSEKNTNKDEDEDNANDSNGGISEFSGNDSNYDMNDNDDNEYDNNVDNNSDWLGDNSDSYDEKSESDAAPDYDSDFEGIHGSDEEQDRNRYPIFNPKKDMENPTPQCGMIFSNFKEFKQAVQNWNIKRGRPFKFVKHDILRKQDIDSFRNQVMKENKCFISRLQGYRARKKAFQIIEGSETGQYKKLNAYIKEIERSNPGSTIIMKMVEEYCDAKTRQQKFKRKTKKSKEIMNGLMSDKQKGIKQAVDSVFPNAEHRFCIKHLHANWSLAGFKGKALRDARWAAAKETTPAQFSARMEKMVAIDLDAAKWFDDKPPTQWSRSYCKTFPRCDMLLNNICETLSSKILDARERSIVEMLESLRLYLMQRMQLARVGSKRSGQQKVGCPYGEKYSVNLEDRTCSCRKWDLTGIPCPHAISVIWMVLKDPVDFVDDCYSVENYFKCYEPTILPVNGEIDWPKSDCVAPLPPSCGDTENIERTNGVGPLETTQDYHGSGPHESAEQIELNGPYETTIQNEDIRPRYLNLADVDNRLFDVAFIDNFGQNDGDQSHQKAKTLPVIRRANIVKENFQKRTKKVKDTEALIEDTVACPAPFPNLYDVFGLPRLLKAHSSQEVRSFGFKQKQKK
ncbi:hypothetical protein ACH5RR_039723 [Cinchona calisaya]|uniref:SWIM-type domain-containing protein n=1 Tax=Cinchona calisaya TaxID=153742 RepID=A0ABD2Y1P9_9GENT